MAGLGTGSQGARQRRLCLIVDVEKYSGRSHRAQMRVQDGVAHALDYACERGGVRRQGCALQDRGDGQLLLLPAGVDEAKAVPGLVQGLRDMLPVLNARAAPDEQIRLRAALAQGSVQRAPLGFVAWSVELASRLLDSAELRAALAESAASDMALIVSADLYADTFATGAGGLTGSAFRPVRVDIPEKRFSSDAWISVLPRGRTAPLGVAVPRRAAFRRGAAAVYARAAPPSVCPGPTSWSGRSISMTRRATPRNRTAMTSGTTCTRSTCTGSVRSRRTWAMTGTRTSRPGTRGT